MRVGLIYNGPTDDLLSENTEMTLNLTDSEETIQAVAGALEANGHSVIRLNADQQLPARLAEKGFDIAFNMATGMYGDTRAAHVPAMLEYLQIPHTGAGVLAESICHHKHVMKLFVREYGLDTAPFQFFRRVDEPLNPDLRFPMIVKLPSEGGSLGLDYGSIVENEAQLRTRLELLLPRYKQGAIAEKYIDGREFTVSVLGNTPPYALPIAELLFFGEKPIRLDEPDVSTFERLKQVKGQELEYIPMESKSVAPADVPLELAHRIEQVAIAAYQVTGCLDWARIDLRMDSDGTIYILDINLEPGIAPDYVVNTSAVAAGWSYDKLIGRILDHAIERYPDLHPQRRS